MRRRDYITPREGVEITKRYPLLHLDADFYPILGVARVKVAPGSPTYFACVEESREGHTQVNLIIGGLVVALPVGTLDSLACTVKDAQKAVKVFEKEGNDAA